MTNRYILISCYYTSFLFHKSYFYIPLDFVCFAPKGLYSVNLLYLYNYFISKYIYYNRHYNYIWNI